MATWKESPNWTPFDEINGGQQFTNALTPEDLNALAENIAYLYENQGDEVIPDHTQSDFTLQLANTASGELGVVYSSTEKVSFEAAPSGEVIDTFVDTNFVPRNIKKDVEIFGVVGEYEGEGGGEVIPEFTEVEGFDVFLDEADEGTITVAYSTPQDVKLSAPSGSASAVRLASVDDENFIPSNIKSGVSIFGLTGAYEAETVEEYDGAIVIEEKTIIGTFTHQYTGDSTASSTFEFEIGMTWAEWIESDYNTSSGTTKFSVSNDGRVVRFGGSGSARLYNGSVVCVSTDVILENTTYTSQYVTGGGGSGN